MYLFISSFVILCSFLSFCFDWTIWELKTSNDNKMCYQPAWCGFDAFETCDFYMPVIHMPSKIDVYIVIFIQTSNKCWQISFKF